MEQTYNKTLDDLESANREIDRLLAKGENATDEDMARLEELFEQTENEQDLLNQMSLCME